MYYRKDKFYKIIGIISIVVIIIAILFVVDYLRVSDNLPPIFCISVGSVDDDSLNQELYGLFYKVNKYVYSENNIEYEIGPWWLKFDHSKLRVDVYDEQYVNIYSEDYI